MIIIEKPYVSEMLVDTIAQNGWVVLENEALGIAPIEDGAFETVTSEMASDYYNQVEHPIIYSNSESSISWVLENLPDSELSRYIKLFKDKIEFRKMLSDMYPNFFFKEVLFEDLKSLSVSELKFPLIIKPAVGFLSFGVHTIQSESDWNNAIAIIDKELEVAKGLYPQSVIDSSKFILEEYIVGEEYAVDAYYDKDGNPVILNIFQHPFLSDKDVRDRVYMTSAGIMMKHMARIALLLKNIGDKVNIKNFPMHFELRITEDSELIPIEVNPMRFTGWCAADLAKYAWNINVYECFMKQLKPDWNAILGSATRGVYYFSMAEVPTYVDKTKIDGFEYDVYLANFSKVLEVRRINYEKNPLFMIIFGKTEDKEEVKKILSLRTEDYIISAAKE